MGRFWRSARFLKGNYLNFSKSKKNPHFGHSGADSGRTTVEEKTGLYRFFKFRLYPLGPESTSKWPKSGDFFLLFEKVKSFPFRIRTDLQNRPSTRFSRPDRSSSRFGNFGKLFSIPDLFLYGSIFKIANICSNFGLGWKIEFWADFGGQHGFRKEMI